jgi:hypothetical protein
MPTAIVPILLKSEASPDRNVKEAMLEESGVQVIVKA